MNNTKTMEETPKGFTLIELLITISIIALLATIIITTVNKARVKARNIATVQDARELKNALTLYELEHDGYVDTSSGTLNSYYPAQWQVLENALGEYLSKLPTSRYVGSGFPWYYYYDYTGGKNLAIYDNDSSKCIKLYNGFYLSIKIDGGEDLMENDGGPKDNRYEVLGGDYEITDGLPCAIP